MSYNTQQIMMTLAAFAGTAEKQRLFESVAQQQQRMLTWLNQSLADTSIATGGAWKAIWVGLSNDRANMSYIAQNAAANQFTLSIRGTDFAMKIDRQEDFEVGTTVSFAEQAGAPSTISQGAMEAFTELTNAVSAATQTTLAQQFESLANSNPGAQFFITGHSLGGCLATTVALYLNNLAQSWSNKASFQVYTFAAPTAGLQDFASLFAKTFVTSSWRIYNIWDAVPNAWQTLSNIDSYYPGGPLATSFVQKEVAKYQASLNGNAYVQPITTDVPINQQELRDPKHIDNTTYDFLEQVAFQHNGNTYLTLLGAPTVTVQT
jgi:hypothetical protein